MIFLSHHYNKPLAPIAGIIVHHVGYLSGQDDGGKSQEHGQTKLENHQGFCQSCFSSDFQPSLHDLTGLESRQNKGRPASRAKPRQKPYGRKPEDIEAAEHRTQGKVFSGQAVKFHQQKFSQNKAQNDRQETDHQAFTDKLPNQLYPAGAKNLAHAHLHGPDGR